MSLIRLTKALKSKVFKGIGWPIYAVIPNRDFVYIFSKDSDLMNKVGQVVIDEYQNSAYRISTEIWELSDNPPKPIATFRTN